MWLERARLDPRVDFFPSYNTTRFGRDTALQETHAEIEILVFGPVGSLSGEGYFSSKGRARPLSFSHLSCR